MTKNVTFDTKLGHHDFPVTWPCLDKKDSNDLCIQNKITPSKHPTVHIILVHESENIIQWIFYREKLQFADERGGRG